MRSNVLRMYYFHEVVVVKSLVCVCVCVAAGAYCVCACAVTAASRDNVDAAGVSSINSNARIVCSIIVCVRVRVYTRVWVQDEGQCCKVCAQLRACEVLMLR
jgi:hypothetical protein